MEAHYNLLPFLQLLVFGIIGGRFKYHLYRFRRDTQLPNSRIKIVRFRSLGRRYRGTPYAGR